MASRMLRRSPLLPLAAAWPLLLGVACSAGALDVTPDGGAGDGGTDPRPGPDAGRDAGEHGALGPIKADGSWKNFVEFPDDPFLVVSPDASPKWVKFVIDPSQPTTIYFQDSNAYAFHYDFARTHWDSLGAMTPADFEAITLHAEGQRLVTGAVLFPGKTGITEAGIEIIRNDAYSKEDVLRYFAPIKAAIRAAEGVTVRTFYFPSPDQRAAAEQESAWFLAHGIEIGSIARWLDQDSCYAPGWAYGNWVYVTRNEIADAFLDGRLHGSDILLTDSVPAEVPRVAAIVSLTPATPNSHVAILAKTFGIPFVYAREPAMQAKLQGLVGSEALLRTVPSSSDNGTEGCIVQAFESTGLSATGRAELLSLKAPRPVTIVPKDGSGPLTADTAQLLPSDLGRFGGKASNFGSLRRAIPQNSPTGMGISFSLWNAFFAQTTDGGTSLQSAILTRLAPFHEPVTDVAALEAKLVEIRALIDAASVPAAQQGPLLQALQDFGFDPAKKAKFRSSTNVEDGAELSGAGLYDSYSGCLADDLDADAAGPSQCDAGEPKEKGALAAIRKAYRSFYNTGAVLERIRYGLDETKVGMALLVNKSFPDAEEAANGVVTFRMPSWGGMTATMVSQVGAESITNPEGSSVPEVAQLSCYDQNAANCTVSFSQGSSRLPIGGRVLQSPADYQGFAALFMAAGAQFSTDLQSAAGEEATLDVEYKKTTDGTLFLKQIRLVPRPATASTPFYFNVPTPMCMYAQEGGDLLATHRTKASFAFELGNRLFEPTEPTRAMVSNVNGTARADGASYPLQGAVASFPAATFGAQPLSPDGPELVPTAGWREANGRRQLLLVRSGWVQSPIVVPADLSLESTFTYDAARPFYDSVTAAPGARTDDFSSLAACARVEPADEDIVVEFDGLRGIHVKTTFRHAKAEGPFQKTAPIARFVSTVLTGWTAEPVTVTSELAQTGIPAHHNFDYSFVIEPGLDPALTTAQRTALEASGIKAVVGSGSPTMPGGMTPSLLILQDGRLVTE